MIRLDLTAIIVLSLALSALLVYGAMRIGESLAAHQQQQIQAIERLAP